VFSETGSATIRLRRLDECGRRYYRDSREQHSQAGCHPKPESGPAVFPFVCHQAHYVACQDGRALDQGPANGWAQASELGESDPIDGHPPIQHSAHQDPQETISQRLYDAEKALYTPATDARVPLVAARASYKGGTLPAKQAGILLSRKSIAVTAFGSSPDAPEQSCGCGEQAGQSGEVEVRLPQGFRAVSVLGVNLRGVTTGKPIAIIGQAFRFRLGAYAPASFVLESSVR
jgi:hypothetical protein